ncbi:YcxB family protein [Paraglaciecola aquimarina]|uniref:YcxB family protein n=1 Tax=Paraglaciecola algarum TaxID=3050085 RepID=A0ABS9D4V4_9ALTE|nr:YcxB family protein [Paraglaciecola sp. G1-23]MCF2947956.1 YcxB family protein [Paraglaciecola sp. G1-23]
MPFNYTTTYTLDKSHFSETFDESVTIDPSKKIYLKSVLLGMFGAALLLFTALDPYVCWFVIALGALEALSIRFRKPWWLARQMLSKAANTELTLTIDEEGVCTKSFSVESKIAWEDVTKIEQTEQGFLLYQEKQKSYLSNRILSDDAQQFIKAKAV